MLVRRHARRMGRLPDNGLAFAKQGQMDDSQAPEVAYSLLVAHIVALDDLPLSPGGTVAKQWSILCGDHYG